MSRVTQITESLKQHLNEAYNPVDDITRYFEKNNPKKWDWQDADPKLDKAIETLISSFEKKFGSWGNVVYMLDNCTVVIEDESGEDVAATLDGSKWVRVKASNRNKRPNVFLASV